MIACPNCKRRVFTRRDILYAALDGSAPCRICGRTARLDILSRWVISCVIALVLPGILLYGDVFYSGHLFLVSLFIILSAWRLLSWIGFPFLALEEVEASSAIDRKQSILILAVLLAAAMVLDGFMASRFDADEAIESGPAPSAARRSP